MARIDDLLQPGESLLYSARLAPIVYLPAGLVGGFGALSVLQGEWVGLAFLAAGLLMGAFAHLRRMTTVLAVTDRRVLIREGLLRREVGDVGLGRLDGLRVHQSVLGRMLGYGRVSFVGAGGTRSSARSRQRGETEPDDGLAPIDDPHGFRDAVCQLQDRANVASVPPVSTDPVGQLERLAALQASGALSETEFERAKAKLLT